MVGATAGHQAQHVREKVKQEELWVERWVPFQKEGGGPF